MTGVALIGLGMVAGTHLAALSDAPDIDLVGVMGRDAAKAETFASKAGGNLRIYRDVQEIAQDDQVDFVILATPPDARLEIVDALSTAGKPILMEKPIERDLAAALHLVAMCEDRSVPLGIVLQHRARVASQALKDAVQCGMLGDVISIEIRVPWWRDQSYYDAPGRGTYARDGGGVMINQAIHTLDLACWIFGPFASLQALMHTTSTHKMEAEDWAGAVFTLKNGAVGSLTASTASFPGSAESIAVQGTHAAAHLESGVLTITTRDGSVTTTGDTATTGAGADPMAFTHAWHQTVIENFAKHLTSGVDVLASGHSALLAHYVIDAMQKSSRGGLKVEVDNL